MTKLFMKYINPNEYDPKQVIDEYSDYWILTFEDAQNNALLQVLVPPDIDGEDAYEKCYEYAVDCKYANDGFSTQDKKHRNNAPLILLNK